MEPRVAETSTPQATARPASPAASGAATGDWTVEKILNWTRQFLQEKGSPSPRVDAEILLAHAFSCDRILLYARFREPAPQSVRDQMRSLVQRRATHEPIAYLVGHKEFHSLKFAVSPAVLVPRPETETLVEAALESLAERAPIPSGEVDPFGPAPQEVRVLDLGTGSGCLAVTLAKRNPGAQVTAVDVSPDAVALAKRNAEAHGVSDRVRVVEGDLFSAVAGQRFDLIVSNPPYVRTEELSGLQADVRDHEPHLALDGGTDGLEIARRLIAAAPSHLTAGGELMLELDPRQMAAARESLEAAGFSHVRVRRDAAGDERVVLARWTPAS